MNRVQSLKAIRVKRNKKLRRFFATLQKEKHQWRYDALVEATGEAFNLSPRTVKAILNKEGNYAD